MRQRFLVLLTVMLLGALTHIRAAESFTVTIDNLIYECADSEATVTGMEDPSATTCNIPETIIHDGVKYTVTTIGERAFFNCVGLKSVTLGNSITHIETFAFADCSGLSECRMPGSLISIGYLAFACCVSLPEISIPNSVTHIDKYAFYECAGLTNIRIPDSVTSIGIGIFEACTGLTEVCLPNSVTYIGEHAFDGCSALTEIRIPDSVTHIGSSAFAHCAALSEVTIGNSVKSIDQEAFYRCTALTEVRIPNSVTSIGAKSFYQCYSLSNVTLGKSVNFIGMNAFASCTKLSEVTLPESITDISAYTFSGCTALTEIRIPDSVKTIDDFAFAGCTALTEIRIPDSVTSIGSEAFSGCTSLIRVTFGNSIERIGSDAFVQCDPLAEVVITNLRGWCSVAFDKKEDNPIDMTLYGFRTPEMEKAIQHLVLDMPGEDIADYAFYGASHLKTVRINTKKIGRQSFDKCTKIEHICLNVEELDYGVFDSSSNLKAIYSMTKTPPVTYGIPFYNIINPTLYVPIGSIGAYRASAYCWSKFLDIRECDFSDIDSIFTADHEPMGAVVDISADSADLNLTVADGVISAEAEADTLITIYNLQGACIQAGKGMVSVAVVPGMYIVTAGERVYKIAVR